MNYQYANKFYRLPPDIQIKNRQMPLFEPVMMASAGHMDSERSTGHYLKRYSDEEYIIIYCISGFGWYEEFGSRRRVSPGELLLLYPETLHCYGSSDNEPWDIFWSCFCGRDVPHILQMLNTSGGSILINIGHQPRIISTFTELLDIFDLGYTQQNLLFATACLQKILGYLTVLRAYHGKAYSESIIENSITYMLSNINQPLTLQELAEKVNLSKDYYVRYFLAKTGYTPIDYFIRLKLQKACNLLNNPVLTVKEVASTLGFQDTYYFSRLFKKKMGYSPSDYRKLVRV